MMNHGESSPRSTSSRRAGARTPPFYDKSSSRSSPVSFELPPYPSTPSPRFTSFTTGSHNARPGSAQSTPRYSTRLSSSLGATDPESRRQFFGRVAPSSSASGRLHHHPSVLDEPERLAQYAPAKRALSGAMILALGAMTWMSSFPADAPPHKREVLGVIFFFLACATAYAFLSWTELRAHEESRFVASTPRRRESVVTVENAENDVPAVGAGFEGGLAFIHTPSHTWAENVLRNAGASSSPRGLLTPQPPRPPSSSP